MPLSHLNVLYLFFFSKNYFYYITAEPLKYSNIAAIIL